jgi:hypothetical protein
MRSSYIFRMTVKLSLTCYKAFSFTPSLERNLCKYIDRTAEVTTRNDLKDFWKTQSNFSFVQNFSKTLSIGIYAFKIIFIGQNEIQLLQSVTTCCFGSLSAGRCYLIPSSKIHFISIWARKTQL